MQMRSQESSKDTQTTQEKYMIEVFQYIPSATSSVLTVAHSGPMLELDTRCLRCTFHAMHGRSVAQLKRNTTPLNQPFTFSDSAKSFQL